MSFEGFDATPLIENTGFVAPLELPESAAAGSEPTLDNALRQAAAASATAPPMDREEMREATLLDLWGGAATRTAFTPLTIGAMAALADEPSAGNDGAAKGSAPTGPLPESTDGDASAPDDRPLTIKEMKLVANGNRQFDSTDYYWEEMSTGDYEWAQMNFMSDVRAGVERAIEDATSQAQAEQMAHDFLISIGLGSQVHVNNPSTGPNDNIVVVAESPQPTLISGLTLTLADWGLEQIDLAIAYDQLDRASIDIRVDPDVPMTEANQQALHRLEVMKDKVSAYLASLPANGVFMTPKGPLTVAELRDRWEKTDFHITNHDYESDDAFPRGGYTHFRNGDPEFETSITNLVGYMTNEMSALWYILHELSHATTLGELSHHQLWSAGTPGLADFSSNERFANDIARLMAETMGHPFDPEFQRRDGFSVDPGMTFVPNPEGSGGPGSGTGGGGGGGGGEIGG